MEYSSKEGWADKKKSNLAIGKFLHGVLLMISFFRFTKGASQLIP